MIASLLAKFAIEAALGGVAGAALGLIKPTPLGVSKAILNAARKGTKRKATHAEIDMIEKSGAMQSVIDNWF